MQEIIARAKSLRDQVEELMPDGRRETLSYVMGKKSMVWFGLVSGHVPWLGGS